MINLSYALQCTILEMIGSGIPIITHGVPLRKAESWRERSRKWVSRLRKSRPLPRRDPILGMTYDNLFDNNRATGCRVTCRLKAHLGIRKWILETRKRIVHFLATNCSWPPVPAKPLPKGLNLDGGSRVMWA